MYGRPQSIWGLSAAARADGGSWSGGRTVSVFGQISLSPVGVLTTSPF